MSAHLYRKEQIQEFLEFATTKLQEKYPLFEISLVENSSERIAAIYSEVIFPRIKSLAQQNINIYKIAASYEMSCTYVQPFIIKGNAQHSSRHLNAHVAFALACTMIDSMWNKYGNPDRQNSELLMGTVEHKTIQTVPKVMNHVDGDNALELSHDEHLEWLAHKDVEDFSIYSTAVFLRLYFTFQRMTHVF